jgi:uncharacterized protein YjbJ (UPF0337 family)
MNEIVIEIPKDPTEASQVMTSREAQAREIVKHADEQPHTSLKEKLESTLDNTVGAGTTDKVSGTAKEMLGKVEERVGELLGNRETQARGIVHRADGKAQHTLGALKEETQDAMDDAAEALHQAAEAAKKIV